VDVGHIGEVIFETSAQRVLTPGGMRLSREARYEDHQVQGELPRSEFIAPDLSEVELDIHLRAGLVADPVREAEKISVYCRQGRVVRLLIAGWNIGKFTVRKFSQDWKYLKPGGGGVQVIDLKLTLKEYV
jgi:hypothetical protein